MRKTAAMSPKLAYHGTNGDYFAKHADSGTWNAFVDRPSMLQLAGNVSGKHILDAGCGAGHYAADLVESGATVVGVEGSAVLVAHAQARLGDRAEIRQHDLNTSLDTRLTLRPSTAWSAHWCFIT